MSFEGVTEVEKAALKERFAATPAEERDYEIMLAVKEIGAAHVACQQRIWGNGKKGHMSRIYCWLGVLSLVVLLSAGPEVAPIIGKVIKALMAIL